MAISFDPESKSYSDGVTTLEIKDGAYEIDSLEKLKLFRDAVNAGNNFRGETVRLTQSVDLQDEEWTPIGRSGAVFAGTFDGGGNTVSNLTITRDLINTADNCGVGFFGYTNAPAKIIDLNIENVDITGSLYIGAVVGYGFTGAEISNCHVSGDVEIEGWWYIGGIGGNGYVSKVDGCTVIGNEGSYIKGIDGSYVGGIWGYRGEGSMAISDSQVVNIDISGVDRVGGICGIAHYGYYRRLRNPPVIHYYL
ncbi:MAG: GLUG motif-containing protein [Victivallaceae bacterium]